MYANHLRLAEHRVAATALPSGMADLRAVWATVMRRRLVLAAALLLCVGLTTVWLLVTPSIYTATTTLLIEPRKTNTVKEDAIVSNLQLDANTIATEVALIKSFAVFQRVVERLKLTGTAAFLSKPEGFDFGRIVSALLFGGSVVDGSPDARQGAEVGALRPPLSSDMIEIVRKIEMGTSVHRVATTYFMEVSFAHENPELAAAISNAVAAAYLDEQLEARHQASQRAATWLSDGVTALRSKLEASERALADHRARHNLANPEAGTLADQQASQINAQLVAVRAQIAESKAKYEQARRILEGGAAIESFAAIMNSPTVGALRAQETAIAREQADLQTRYGPEHPAMLKIRAQQADIARQIKGEISRVVQTLKADYEFSQEKERSLAASFQELSGNRNANEETIIRLRELERDAQSTRSLYEATLTRFKEAEQQMSLKAAESRIVEPALVPRQPSFPKAGTSLLLAVFAGLLLGAVTVSFLELRESGFTGAAQIEQAVGLRVLAMVPALKSGELELEAGQAVSIPGYLARKPQSRFGESVRSARLLTQMSATQAAKLVLVTSSTSGEGKTTIAMSMAYSAAMASRQRVLLVDCDLRACSASRQLNLANKPGLTNILADQTVYEEVTYRSNLPNLHILPAGTELLRPQALLENERMPNLLSRLRDEYDAIYIDTPPLLPVIDTTLLLPAVERIVFVVSWRKTPRKVVIGAAQMLAKFEDRISGVVVNHVMIDKLMAYDPGNTYHHESYKAYYVG